MPANQDTPGLRCRDSEFDASIDEADPIEVLGCLFRPSDVLWAVDRAAYFEKLDEYIGTKQDRVFDTIRKQSPLPLAFRVYQFLNADNAIEKHRRLQDAWETL